MNYKLGADRIELVAVGFLYTETVPKPMPEDCSYANDILILFIKSPYFLHYCIASDFYWVGMETIASKNG